MSQAHSSQLTLRLPLAQAPDLSLPQHLNKRNYLTSKKQNHLQAAITSGS